MTAHDLMAQLSRAISDAPHRMCACGHEAERHEYQACTAVKCDCDIRRFEVEQGGVHYVDTDEWISLAEHLRRRSH